MLAPYINKYLNKRSLMDVYDTISPSSIKQQPHNNISLQSIDLNQYYDTKLIDYKKSQNSNSVESVKKSKTNRKSIFKGNKGLLESASTATAMSRYKSSNKLMLPTIG